jgi:surface protein
MSFMFSKSLFNQDLGDWDVSRVTSMKGMFKDFNDRLPFASKNPFNQAIGRWNVGKVKDMSSLFSNSIFNHPIGDWDVRNVRHFI